MGRPIPAFLDEVAEFLDDEVLPEVYNEHYYYDNCVLRTNYDEERLKIRNVSFCERSTDGKVHRVNDVLSKADVRFEFHFRGDEPLCGSWTEIMTSFTATLHVPSVEVPTALKWERSGASGNLKADEWFDANRDYVASDVDAKTAMRTAIAEHLYRVVPEFRTQSGRDVLSPVVLRTMYREDTNIIDQLEPGEREN